MDRYWAQNWNVDLCYNIAMSKSGKFAGILTSCLLLNSAFAQQLQDTSIGKECNSAEFDQALAQVDPTLANYNFQCNHFKLLKEANNLVILASLYNKFKFELVAGTGGKLDGQANNVLISSLADVMTE